MPRTLNTAGLLLASALLCTSCAVAPTVCPKLPEPPAKVPLGLSFQDEMQQFLRGSLPEPISYELSLPPAKIGSGLRSKP